MTAITDVLQQVQAQAAQLAPEQQEALAVQVQQVLEDFLDNLLWERLFSSEAGQATLNRLTAEAMADIARGDVEDGGFGD